MSLFTQSSVAVMAAALGLAGFALTRTLRPTARKAPYARKAIASPLSSLLPQLSESQVARLPYPPDFFPGARDVCTPYGQMRVYEWGPAAGKRIVMVPGDTTPAPIFGIIARSMVERGFRVLILGKLCQSTPNFEDFGGSLLMESNVMADSLDTWGRGYSDSPLSAPHEVGLYELQILFAITSSPLSWTGTSESFSIIGFSLGGAITMSFASHFPNLIESIILLAPAGIMQSLPQGYSSIFLHHHQWVPYNYLRRVVAGVIGITPQKPSVSAAESPTSKRVPQDDPDLPALWQWQFDTHEGFVHSFADTVRNGPMQYQQQSWQRVCDIICGNDTEPATSHSKLKNSRVLVICGESDAVVNPDETKEEMSRLLPNHVEFRTVPGGHGFPIPSGKATLHHICEFWKLPA